MTVSVLCECSLCLLCCMAHHCVWFAVGEANSPGMFAHPSGLRWKEVKSASAVVCNFLSGAKLAFIHPNLLEFEEGVGGLETPHWNKRNHTFICRQVKINPQHAALIGHMMILN